MKEKDENLIIVSAPVNSLILSPLATKARCKELYRKWMKEVFDEDIK